MRLLLIMFTLIYTLGANEVEWFSSYDEAIKQAKVKNKPVLIVMTKEHCRWCKKLELKTLENEEIKKKLSENFINVVLVRETSKFPAYLKARIFPTSFFITKNERVIYKMPGYWGIEDFNSIIDDALRKLKN